MIDKTNKEHLIALLLIVQEGCLIKRSSNASLEGALMSLGWLIQSTRRNELSATDLGLRESKAYLNKFWPEHEAAAASMIHLFGRINSRNLDQVAKQLEVRGTGKLNLPATVNRKTFAAAVCSHSKAELPEETIERYPGIQLTNDHCVFARTNKGAIFATGHDDMAKQLCCDDVMRVCGMVTLTERMLMDSWTFAGVRPRAVVTVENRATFYDMTLPDGVMSVLVEGWNTPLAISFLKNFDEIPLIHFGDFDPNGSLIRKHLQVALNREVRWLMPEFTAEYIETHSMKLAAGAEGWDKATVDVSEASFMSLLRATGRWIEQEAITLDPRLRNCIESMIDGT